MSVPAPVNGNGNFVKVLNKAGQIEQLDASDAQVSAVTSETVTSQLYRDVLNIPGKGTLQSVVGYAPNTFGTTGAAGGVFLNVKPGLAPATAATDVQLLTLPANAVIVKVQATNNGTTINSGGAPTFTVGREAWTAAAPSDASFLALTNLTNINTDGGVYAVGEAAAFVAAAGANAQLGGTGVPRTVVTVDATASNGNVGVLVNAAALIAGDFAVRIEYLL